jgi:hypothetical protein
VQAYFFFLVIAKIDAFGNIFGIDLGSRVATFFFVHDTKTGKSLPTQYKMYQMVIKYPKST